MTIYNPTDKIDITSNVNEPTVVIIKSSKKITKQIPHAERYYRELKEFIKRSLGYNSVRFHTHREGRAPSADGALYVSHGNGFHVKKFLPPELQMVFVSLNPTDTPTAEDFILTEKQMVSVLHVGVQLQRPLHRQIK